jgi:hypothetical protein
MEKNFLEKNSNGYATEREEKGEKVFMDSI